MMDEKPYTITLCGSSRFVGYFAWMQWQIEKKGILALGLHLIPGDTLDEAVPDHLAEYEGVAEIMDALHLKKIDMSDEVLVLAIGGYTGESTQREVKYAEQSGKPITQVISIDECNEYLLTLDARELVHDG